MREHCIAIVGSRNYPFRWKVFYAVRRLNDKYPHVKIVSGGCPKGVDRWVREAVEELGIQDRFIEIPVTQEEWNTYGRSAGHRRNSKVVDACTCLLAFHDGQSPGTRDAMQKAWAAGKKVGCVEDQHPEHEDD